MQAPDDAARDATDGERPRVTVGWIARVAIGLLIATGAVLAMAKQRTRALEPAELFTQWFGASATPEGYELLDASRSWAGVEILRLARADRDATPEPSRNAVEPTKPEGEPKPGGEPRVDWSKLPAKPAGDLPREILIARYPREAAAEALEQLFRPREFGDANWLGAEGGKLVLDQGQLDWGALSARYVFEREHEPGLTFRDVVRVNLSTSDDAQVLFARFPRNSTGSVDVVERLLGSLRASASATR